MTIQPPTTAPPVAWVVLPPVGHGDPWVPTGCAEVGCVEWKCAHCHVRNCGALGDCMWCKRERGAEA